MKTLDLILGLLFGILASSITVPETPITHPENSRHFVFSKISTGKYVSSPEEVQAKVSYREKSELNTPLPGKWHELLDAELTHWDKFIGVPHESVELPAVFPKSQDGISGIPIGLGKDPKGVFTTKIKDKETILCISGEIYGGLSTKESYENYHFSCQFKWGELKWEPRLDKRRDNGILYHCSGPHGAFWNVWMRSLEFQVQERDFGDFFPLAGTIANIQVGQEAKPHIFTPGGPELSFSFEKGFPGGQGIRSENREKAHGQWNTLEVYTRRDSAVHVVNGKVVMALTKSRYLKEGEIVPLKAGKIQLQSEAAEAYYRRIKIRNIQQFPAAIKKAAGW